MAGTITALKVQKRDKERISVFLDGEFAFGVTAFAAATLKKGQQLSEAEIEKLKSQDELSKAYNRALRYLGFRARSQAEMERYLRGKDYSAGVIDLTVRRLLDEQYLDDEAFARYWLENREAFRPRGERYLRYELRQKGIAEAVIERVLGDVEESASAWKAIEGKLYRWKNLAEEDFKKKVMGFLNRRGFGYDVAREVCERAWTAVDLPDE